MASFSLDDIRAAAERKYGSTTIGDVELLNPLRLKAEDRKALLKLQDDMQADDADQEDLIRQSIVLVAKNKADARALVADLDLAMLVTIFEHYGKETEAGEASASQN